MLSWTIRLESRVERIKNEVPHRSNAVAAYESTPPRELFTPPREMFVNPPQWKSGGYPHRGNCSEFDPSEEISSDFDSNPCQLFVVTTDSLLDFLDRITDKYLNARGETKWQPT